jgi:hypothetical protein
LNPQDKTADQYQHSYLKTTDHNKTPIPVEIHRARFEIRLAGSALPYETIGSWQGFKFETLTAYISFGREDATASLTEQAIVTAYGDRASHKKAIPRRSGGGTRTRIMPADTRLNQIVYDELRQLTRRWSRVRKERKLRE